MTTNIPTIPTNIKEFLMENKVVSIATANEQEVWSANCFYAFHQETASLIILTKRETKHGQMMLARPKIAGTISVQPEGIRDISGLQFTARAECLEHNDPNREIFRQAYTNIHTMAKLMDSDVWVLHLDWIKHSDNKMVFARKTVWERV